MIQERTNVRKDDRLVFVGNKQVGLIGFEEGKNERKAYCFESEF